MNNITLSIIIPAYNEAERIEYTLRSLEQYFKDKDFSHEVIFVDDGSTDGTIDVIKNYQGNFPHVRVLENEKNQGKGYAVNRGMLQARGDYRLFMDADNSVDISHLDSFLSWIKNGYDVVIGSIRVDNSSVSENAGVHRRILGDCAKVLIRIFAIPDIKDTQRGFKLFSAEAANIIFPRQTIKRFGFDIELLVIAWINGLKIKELPVVWDNPSGSKVTLWSYIQTLRELMRITRNRLLRKYAMRVSEHYSIKI